MKSYTGLDQSRKLAGILSIESADMRYGYIAPYDYSDRMYDGGYDEIPYPKDFLIKNPNFSADEYEAELPCWSLVALLSVLDFPSLTQNKEDEWEVCVPNHKSDGYIEVSADNPVDACYEMIIKLRGLNLL